jgi:hypothetical protein
MVDLAAETSDRRAAAGIFGRQDGRGSQFNVLRCVQRDILLVFWCRGLIINLDEHIRAKWALMSTSRSY